MDTQTLSLSELTVTEFKTINKELGKHGLSFSEVRLEKWASGTIPSDCIICIRVRHFYDMYMIVVKRFEDAYFNREEQALYQSAYA